MRTTWLNTGTKEVSESEAGGGEQRTLSPTLHEEGENDVAASMKSVVGRSCRSTLARFKSLGSSKRVLSSDSNSICQRSED